MALALLAPTLAGAAPDPATAPAATTAAAFKRHQRERLLEYGRRRFEENARAAAEAGATPAARAAARDQAIARARATALAATPANVRINDPIGEPADAAQAGASAAAWNGRLLVAWNDGATGQGIGWSGDGGATFRDTLPPPLAGGVQWFRDPVVVVNGKTGAFYYAARTLGPGVASGIAVVKATLTATTLTWGAPARARITDGITQTLDHPWLAADSTSGALYLTSTLFTTLDDTIQFQRSGDDNQTWTVPQTLSDPQSAGLVQGARPAVGPDGRLHVAWYEIGPIDADYIKVRTSDNQSQGFTPEVIAATPFENYGTGAPGLNVEHGLMYPSLAVDCTQGPHRGRRYLAYHESINYYNDLFGIGGGLASVEPDGYFASANAFVPGQILRGTLNGLSDLDCFAFPAVAGTSYIFYCDSIPTPLYDMRLYCASDTLTRLAYAGDLAAPAGGTGLIVWTAPASGTYYLRMSFLAGGFPGNYRVQTGIAGHGSEPGRDQRDVMMAWSDGGAWSSGIRVNDDAPGYDNWMPEVAVGADGAPCVVWVDWRDDACGGASRLYAARSDNGGATWLANQPVADAASAWSEVASNLTPNQGEYFALASEPGRLHAVWTDGRGGNPDIYGAALDTRFDITSCARDTVIAVGQPATASLRFTGRNRNLLFGNTYTATASSARGWPVSPAGPMSAAAGGDFGASLAIAVPDTAAPGISTVCAIVWNAAHTQSDTCCMKVDVHVGPLAVEPDRLRFALAPSVPNPARGAARIDFSLPRDGRARLRLYGLRGDVVRTLADGAFHAGPHQVTWDGRDAHGRLVAPGTYFVRLDAAGQSATRHLVWVR